MDIPSAAIVQQIAPGKFFEPLTREFQDLYPERAPDVLFWRGAVDRLFGKRQERLRDLFIDQIDWQIRLETGVSFGQRVGEWTEKTQLARILLEAGIALTPATKPPELFREGFALIRYESYFQAKSLLLADVCREMESRQKSCLSEDLSIGVCMHLARTYLRCKHVADFVSARDKKFVTTKDGSSRRPDFCCLDSSNEIIFVESKGTTQDDSVLSAKIKDGKEQIKNAMTTQRIRQANEHFVIATQFATSSTGGPSVTVVDDPPAKAGIEKQTDDSFEFIKLSYAKVFRYANRDDLANALLEGRALRSRPTNAEFNPVGFDPFGNLLLVEKNIFESLNNQDHQSLKTSLEALDTKKFEAAVDGKIVLSNGVALLPPWA